MIERARRWLQGLGGEPTVILCGSSALLIVSHYQGSTGAMNELFGSRIGEHPARPVLGYLWWFASSLLLYGVMPLVLSVAFKGSFHRRYGLGLGDWKAGLSITGVFLGVMLPLTYWASHWGSFQGQYPLAGNAAYLLHLGEGKTEFSLTLFLVYELGYFLYFLAWEFLFRGWMLNGLLPAYGRAGAILIQMAPFAVMHLGKAELEALGSIVAGIALGLLALRTRSCWYGGLIHGVVAVWMDVVSAWPVLMKGGV